MPIVYQITGNPEDQKFAAFYPYDYPCLNGKALFTPLKSLKAKDTISELLAGLQPVNTAESIIPNPIDVQTNKKDGLYKIVFNNPDLLGLKVLVLWYTKVDGTGHTTTNTYSDEKITKNISVGSNSVKLMDMYGNSLIPIIKNNNGVNEVELDIGEKPIYLTLSENRPGFIAGIFIALTRTIEGVKEKAIGIVNLFSTLEVQKTIEGVKEYFSIPEAHSAPPTSTPNPTVSVSPPSDKQGTIFYYTGNQYKPNGIVEWHVRKPDGIEYTPDNFTGKVDGSGNFNYNYASGCGNQVGTYTLWAFDKYTGKRSNDATQIITASASCVSVQYQVYFSNTGWMTDWVQDEQTAGKPNGNQMEAIKIKTTSYGITYRAHVAYDGWLPWVSDGAVAGTTGEGKSLQAIQIKLQNAPSTLHVYYRVYVNGRGWQGWVSDETTAGTTGLGLPVEAIEIKIQS